MTIEVAQLGPTLMKVAISLAAISFAFIVAKFKKLSWQEDLGIARPDVRLGFIWFAIYIAWMLGSNYFMNWRGPWDFTIWIQTPLAVSILRVLAVSILGPIAEELIFRGMLFSRFSRTKMGAFGAIVLTSALWAVMHYFYSPGVIGVIFIGGLLLGAARHYSKSIVFPVLMHITWNLFAVW